MKETIDDRTVTLQEDLPDFSLDLNDLKELDALASKLGYEMQLNRAAYRDLEISGTAAQILAKFAPMTDSLELPLIAFKKQNTEFPEFFENVWVFSWSNTITVTTKVSERDRGLEILQTLLGFFSLQNKKLRAEEAPSYLYLRPRQSVQFVKKPQPIPLDQPRVLLNTIDSKLRKLIRVPPENEGQVQEAIEQILILKDYEYHREIERVPSGTKSTVPDFTLDALGIALDAKLCKKPEDEKRILEEINSDITVYQTKYPKLIFIVYDIGVIRDTDKFGNEVRKQKDVYFTVVKH